MRGSSKASHVALAILAEAMEFSPKSVAYNGNVYTRMWGSVFSSLNLKLHRFQFVYDTMQIDRK